MSFSSSEPSSGFLGKPPIYYNAETDLWLVGEGAYEAHLSLLAEDDSPGDIYNVQDVLRGDFPLKISEHRTVRRYDSEELLELGEYMLDLIDPYKLIPKVMERGSRVGLTPSADTYSRRFGSFGSFLTELGEAGLVRRSTFDHWTLSDHVHDILELAREKGRKPTKKDINDRAKPGHSLGKPKPSVRVIQAKISLRELYDLAGFLNVQAFDKEDYKLWGVFYLLANGEDAFLTTGLRYLPKAGYAPSTRTVANYFGAISEFEKEVKQTYAKISQAQPSMEEKEERMRSAASHGAIPPALFNRTDSKQDSISHYTRYSILKTLAPSLDEEVKLRLARLTSADQFAIEAYEADQSLTTWKLQGTALLKGFFFDIWPHQYLDKFKVPVLEVRAKRPPIGGFAVTSSVRLPNGYVLKRLAPQRASSLHEPGSKKAKKEVEKIKNRIPSNDSSKYTIRGTKGVRRPRRAESYDEDEDDTIEPID